MDGIPLMGAMLLYGSGLRICEAIRIRVKDVDFGYSQLVVRNGKGRKDRITMLPDLLTGMIQEQIKKVHLLHRKDTKRGYAEVLMAKARAKNIPMQPLSWAGSIFFHHLNFLQTRARAWFIAIIYLIHLFRNQCEKP